MTDICPLGLIWNRILTAMNRIALKLKGFSVLLAAIFALFLTAEVAASELIGVRFGPDGSKTRIVLDLNGAPDYAISGDTTGAGRIFVDFADLAVADNSRNFTAGKGHVSRYAFARQRETQARAVFELKSPARLKEAFVIEPSGSVKKYRLVIDLESATTEEFIASLPTGFGDLTAVIEKATAESSTPGIVIPPAPTQKEVRAPLALKRYTIVVDPGHGGKDPGSQGQSGTLEKNVTLAAAKELAKILKASGNYDVVMTRETNNDGKIKPTQHAELARREALAREAGADLFISLHADAIAQKNVRGASVYTLSKQGTARSASLAKSNGNYFAYDMNLKEIADEKGEVVSDILFDKAQDKTTSNSSRFAKLLIANLTGKTRLLNRSHREGDLRVLLAPDVPAVLLELAFISNAKDEANLNSPVWRRNAMQAVATSIDGYFAGQGFDQHALNAAAGQ